MSEPVAYSCKKCGTLLVPSLMPGGVLCRKCDHATFSPAIRDWVQPGPQPGPWQETHEWRGKFRTPKPGEWYVEDQRDATVHMAYYGPTYPARHIVHPKAKQPEPVVCFCCGKTIAADEEKWADIGGSGALRCGGCEKAHNSGEAARKDKKMAVIAIDTKWQPRCPKCEWSLGNVPRICKDGRLGCKCRRCGHKFFVPGVPPDNYCKAPRPKRPSRIAAVARYYATHPLMLALHYGAAAVASSALGYPQPIHWARDAIAWVASRAAEALV